MYEVSDDATTALSGPPRNLAGMVTTRPTRSPRAMVDSGRTCAQIREALAHARCLQKPVLAWFYALCVWSTATFPPTAVLGLNFQLTIRG